LTDDTPRRRASSVPLGERLAVLESRFNEHIEASTRSHIDSGRLHNDALQLIHKLDERQDKTEGRFDRLFGGAAVVAALTSLILLFNALKSAGVVP
jgi:hypothetical protein